MNLWTKFVLALLRFCKELSYEDLHNMSNNHHQLRHLMGFEREHSFDCVKSGHQNIYDDVSCLNLYMLIELKPIILKF